MRKTFPLFVESEATKITIQVHIFTIYSLKRQLNVIFRIHRINVVLYVHKVGTGLV